MHGLANGARLHPHHPRLSLFLPFQPCPPSRRPAPRAAAGEIIAMQGLMKAPFPPISLSMFNPT